MPDYDLKCEFDVPKIYDLTQELEPNLFGESNDIYSNPDFRNQLPDFGFFKKIK